MALSYSINTIAGKSLFNVLQYNDGHVLLDGKIPFENCRFAIQDVVHQCEF